MPELNPETLHLLRANQEAQVPLKAAARRLQDVLRDATIRPALPSDARTAMESAVNAIDAALDTLKSVAPSTRDSAVNSPDAPTRQQGQFLAYIRAYMLHSHAGVAPTHAILQKYFDLTPPSVNSMLIRLETRGFIRRIPHQARAIELTIHEDLIPPLERRFKA